MELLQLTGNYDEHEDSKQSGDPQEYIPFTGCIRWRLDPSLCNSDETEVELIIRSDEIVAVMFDGHDITEFVYEYGIEDNLQESITEAKRLYARERNGL